MCILLGTMDFYTASVDQLGCPILSQTAQAETMSHIFIEKSNHCRTDAFLKYEMFHKFYCVIIACFVCALTWVLHKCEPLLQRQLPRWGQ